MVQFEAICALATPQGVGAIGVIRVSGEKTFEIVNKIFFGKNLEKVDSHTIHFGTIRDKDKVVDEVLVSVFRSPKSFTKEDVIEISCHGSDYIIRYILKLLIKNGCRMASPGEFTQRAFLNGQFDLVQAEAVADLIAADSEAAHKTAINQMRGGFSKQLSVLREELIHFASLVELELDFGEEDVEFANRDDLKNLIAKIQKQLNPLIDSFDSGNVIKEGVPVAIIGPPNAGKSTLLNTLLNEEKAIVTEIAGTTRDVIEDVIHLEGQKFRFIDTAGIRETTDLVENMGIERSRAAIRRAEIVLFLSDDGIFDDTLLGDFDLEKVIFVRNKIDTSPLAEREREPSPTRRGQGEVYTPELPYVVHSVSSDLLKKARELRKNLTDAEKFLWELLRDRQFKGLKFRRQHPLKEGYILDFFCAEYRLGIEIDGGYHQIQQQKRYDRVREIDIEIGYKIKILRFTNEEIYNDIDKVFKEMDSYTSPLTPLLQGKGNAEQEPSPFRRGQGEVQISAKNKIGIDELKQAILAKVKDRKTSDTVITNLRHYEHLLKANEALDEVLIGIDNGITGDFIAQDIRLALHHLGEITGTITTDDLLANIFSKFCIGK